MFSNYLIINKDKIQTNNINILCKHNKLKINYILNNIIILGIPINITNFQYIDNFPYILIKLNDTNDINLFKTIYEYLQKKINKDIKPIMNHENIIKVKYYGNKQIKNLNNLNISINNIYVKKDSYFINIFLLD